MDWSHHPISFDPWQLYLPLVEIRDQFSVVLAPLLGQDPIIKSRMGLWSPSPQWQECQCLTGPDSALVKTAELAHKFCLYLINACIISPALELVSWLSITILCDYLEMIKRWFKPESLEFHWGT